MNISDKFKPHRVIITEPKSPYYAEAGTAIEYHDESPPWLLVELDNGVTVPVPVADAMPAKDGELKDAEALMQALEQQIAYVRAEMYRLYAELRARKAHMDADVIRVDYLDKLDDVLKVLGDD